jgi:hypothetical protein
VEDFASKVVGKDVKIPMPNVAVDLKQLASSSRGAATGTRMCTPAGRPGRHTLLVTLITLNPCR